MLRRLNLSLADFKGSPLAQQFVQAHVLPDRPWHTRLLPLGSTPIPSLAGNGAFISFTAADVGRPQCVLSQAPAVGSLARAVGWLGVRAGRPCVRSWLLARGETCASAAAACAGCPS